MDVFKTFEFMAGGQWTLMAMVCAACFATAWCLSSALEYLREQHHQRKGPHEPHA